MTCPTWRHPPGVVDSRERGNLGLRCEKLFDLWEQDEEVWNVAQGAARDWANRGYPVDSALRSSRRLAKRMSRLPHVISFTMTTAAPLIIGIGNPHPLENGLTWHPTLGLPYLPASGLKGLVRAWALEDGLAEVEPDDLDRLFGIPAGRHQREPGPDIQPGLGTISVFDALPVAFAQVEHEDGPCQMIDWDVMTPHYGPWYGDPGNLPGDWHDPVPISFLTVGAGVVFQFAVAGRTASQKEDARTVAGWMGEALSALGAGAKTAVGYGLFADFEPGVFDGSGQ